MTIVIIFGWFSEFLRVNYSAWTGARLVSEFRGWSRKYCVGGQWLDGFD